MTNIVRYAVEIGRERNVFGFDLDDLWGDEADLIEDLTRLSVREWYLRVGSPQLRRDRDKLLLVFLAVTRQQVARAGRSSLVYEDFRRSVNVRTFEFLEETAAAAGEQTEDQAVDEPAEPEPPAEAKPAPTAQGKRTSAKTGARAPRAAAKTGSG